jgi:hypothetical protein
MSGRSDACGTKGDGLNSCLASPFPRGSANQRLHKLAYSTNDPYTLSTVNILHFAVINVVVGQAKGKAAGRRRGNCLRRGWLRWNLAMEAKPLRDELKRGKSTKG